MDIVSWIGPQMEDSISKVPLQGNEINDARLRQACREFETVLTSSMLKEGLKSSAATWEDDDEGDQASKGYMEMVHSKMADFLGQQGVMGIGDTLYEQLTGKRPSPPPRV